MYSGNTSRELLKSLNIDFKCFNFQTVLPLYISTTEEF